MEEITQRHISQKLVGDTYTNPETGQKYGDKEKQEDLRAIQVSRDTDSRTNLRVGIRDIDEAIRYYFQNVIKPVVEVNGVLQTVPITYANPERWAEVQREGQFRDKNGKRQLPVIVFKRDSIDRNRKLTSKVDALDPRNFYATSVVWSKRNDYTRFDLNEERVPEADIVMTVVPDFVTMKYSCVILTSLVTQMNPIVESILFASDSYWGDPERFKFQTFVGPVNTEVNTRRGEDRIVKSSFTLSLVGHLLPDTTSTGRHTGIKRHNRTTVSCKIQERCSEKRY